ncbi:Holliday junction branch migration protein RuvA [Nocardioides insulae]|uniref:Holliday junction branch migration protein RuvA n=1 Tax=Nocardioides insulae TaxID=394734 RepID=UPI00040D3843|nr:Holliday junction branch migration protein RuvA [Nocardioides insulae]
MIAFVKGPVAEVTLSSAVVQVGGIGLELLCSPGTLSTLRIGAEATLPTSLVVREDSLTLFGFADEDEKTLFELVQTASGVGPKLAQAMIAVLPPETLRTAIATEDVKTLTRVPGIGQKGAQRIILELKDRVGGPIGGGATPGPAVAPWQAQVSEALVGLGYSSKDADKAVDVVAAEASDDGTAEVGRLLKAALRVLAKV